MIRRYLKEVRGAAAVEFALWLALLTIPTLNVVDLGFYCFQAMQVREAAQVAAQAAEVQCGPNAQTTFPASVNCANLTTTLTSAAQSTSLGTKVTVVTSGLSSPHSGEGYYCLLGSSGQLTAVAPGKNQTDPWVLSAAASAIPALPSDCTGIDANNENDPSDYLIVAVTYTFTPLFKGVTVASLLNSTITETSWIRLG